MTSRPQSPDAQQVVLFDGVCGLCNRSVDFLLKIDRNKILSFSPLQGAFAKTVLPAEKIQQRSSICFVSEGIMYEKSDALLRIASQLGGLWALARIFRIIPAPVRDALYNWIAKNRYRLFGKKETCRMSTPEERARFLP